MTRDIRISQPALGAEEEQAAIRILRGGRLSSGQEVAAFEADFALSLGAAYSVAVSSGTAALVTALAAAGIGPGDEVIVPSFTFFGTVSAVVAAGAIPVFADIDPGSFCLAPEAAEAAVTPRTAAVLPVHLFGHPADLPNLRALASRRGLVLIEDAAQAAGAVRSSKPVGAEGTVAFSFYATKNMTTGEGGMVVTDDHGIAEAARRFRNHGMSEPYLHPSFGLNLRLTEIAAAVGRVQLGRLASLNMRRIRNARYYDSLLTRVLVPPRLLGITHVFHQYTVRVLQGRDDAVGRLNERGIEARAYYPIPAHRQPVWKGAVRSNDLPETERASREAMSLPVHPSLTSDELERVVKEVESVC